MKCDLLTRWRYSPQVLEVSIRVSLSSVLVYI